MEVVSNDLTGAELSTGADAEYFDGLLGGILKQQKCSSCETWHWPAVWRCSTCGGWQQEWLDVEFCGKIFSWTRTWHQFGGLNAIATPFIPVVVELSHISASRLLGLLDAQDNDPKIGQSVIGRVGTISYGDIEYPSLRWSVEP